MSNYWTFDNYRNGLAGVEGTIELLDGDCGGRSVYHPDPTNPAVLPAQDILYALRTSRRAREDFRKVFPTLLPEEQARLTELLENNRAEAALLQDPQAVNDRIQAKSIRSTPVRTCGPRGGTGY